MIRSRISSRDVLATQRLFPTQAINLGSSYITRKLDIQIIVQGSFALFYIVLRKKCTIEVEKAAS